MSIRRKITEYLQNWYIQENGARGVLLVRGVRQCGKTYIVNRFLQNAFGVDYYGFDFEKDDSLKKAIYQASSLVEIFLDLAMQKIYLYETCVFFGISA